MEGIGGREGEIWPVGGGHPGTRGRACRIGRSRGGEAPCRRGVGAVDGDVKGSPDNAEDSVADGINGGR